MLRIQRNEGLMTEWSQAAAASFFQTWLYFGTLHEIFGQYCDASMEKFVRTERGTWLISTAKPDEYLNVLVALKAL